MWVEISHPADHPALHRTAPCHTLLAPNVNSAAAQIPFQKGNCYYSPFYLKCFTLTVLPYSLHKHLNYPTNLFKELPSGCGDPLYYVCFLCNFYFRIFSYIFGIYFALLSSFLRLCLAHFSIFFLVALKTKFLSITLDPSPQKHFEMFCLTWLF